MIFSCLTCLILLGDWILGLWFNGGSEGRVGMEFRFGWLVDVFVKSDGCRRCVSRAVDTSLVMEDGQTLGTGRGPDEAEDACEDACLRMEGIPRTRLARAADAITFRETLGILSIRSGFSS